MKAGHVMSLKRVFISIRNPRSAMSYTAI